MRKLIIAIVIIVSGFLAFNLCFTKAQVGNGTASQNDFLQQYLNSKQQQQTQQTQAQSTQQQSQATNTTAKTGLSTAEKTLVVVYSITLLLAWTNLILGIIALSRWLKQKKAQPAVAEKRLM